MDELIFDRTQTDVDNDTPKRTIQCKRSKQSRKLVSISSRRAKFCRVQYKYNNKNKLDTDRHENSIRDEQNKSQY